MSSTPRWCRALALCGLLGGCEVDEFVVAGETDGCPTSTGAPEAAAEDTCPDDACDPAVSPRAFAERQPQDQP